MMTHWIGRIQTLGMIGLIGATATHLRGAEPATPAETRAASLLKTAHEHLQAGRWGQAAMTFEDVLALGVDLGDDFHFHYGKSLLSAQCQPEAALMAAKEQARLKTHLDPSRDRPWVNSLGMKLVPVPGTRVLFCIWETRVQDYAVYARAASDGIDPWKDPGFRQDDNHPVVSVSWEDAKGFCEWLTQQEKERGELASGQDYRLPTDSERSCAVGLGGRDGRRASQDQSGATSGGYPWGTQWPPPNGAGNYNDYDAVKIAGFHDGWEDTAPVGSFKPNALGLYDLGGNVWEWCEDGENPSATSRVLRGASWDDESPEVLLSSYRRAQPTVFRWNNVGFRVVLARGQDKMK
jgi:hypothetical protein